MVPSSGMWKTLNLVGLNVSTRPGPCDRPAGLPGISDLLFQQAVLGDRDNHVLVDQPLEPRRLVNLLDRLQHIGRGKARIAGAGV